MFSDLCHRWLPVTKEVSQILGCDTFRHHNLVNTHRHHCANHHQDNLVVTSSLRRTRQGRTRWQQQPPTLLKQTGSGIDQSIFTFIAITILITIDNWLLYSIVTIILIKAMSMPSRWLCHCGTQSNAQRNSTPSTSSQNMIFPGGDIFNCCQIIL